MKKEYITPIIIILLLTAALFIGFNFSRFSLIIRNLITTHGQNCEKQNLNSYSYGDNNFNFQFCYPKDWVVKEDSVPHQGASLLLFPQDNKVGGFQLQTLSASLDDLKNRKGYFPQGIFEPPTLDLSKIDKGTKYLVLENTSSRVVFLTRASPVDWEKPNTLYMNWYGQDPIRKNNSYEILYFFDENEDPTAILNMSKAASIVSDSILKNW